MRTSIYRGLQQGAATRRNRYLRAAHRYRALADQVTRMTVQQMRDLLNWDLQVEGAFMLSPDGVRALTPDILRTRFEFSVRQARYHHREWKKWASRNREWRQEMEALEAMTPDQRVRWATR